MFFLLTWDVEMAVTPDDFLALSKAIDGKSNCSEIELRNAYRCAYYAAHHAAKQALPRLGLALAKASNGGSHADVEVSLAAAGTYQSKRLVAQLQRLKRVRVDCDYHLDKNINANVLAVRMAEAQNAFVHLMSLGVPNAAALAE